MKLNAQSKVYVFSLADEFVRLNTLLYPYYEVLTRHRGETLTFYPREANILAEKSFGRERMLHEPRCTDEELSLFDNIEIKETTYQILSATAENSGFCLQLEDFDP